jgi:hypothetical protein
MEQQIGYFQAKAEKLIATYSPNQVASLLYEMAKALDSIMAAKIQAKPEKKAKK